jgi:tRNA(Ile2) C34 agmatinyltransferase TiaS
MSSETKSARNCSSCGEEFVPAKDYYHRCSDCQYGTNQNDYDEADYEISGYDLNVDWYK